MSVILQQRCIILSANDTNLPRDANSIAYCAKWGSKKHKVPILGQNVLGITLKVGDVVLPLDLCLVSKQRRGNRISGKSSLFHQQMIHSERPRIYWALVLLR